MLIMMIMIIIMIMITLSIYGEGKPLCTHPCQDRRTHPEGWPSSRSCTWPAVMIIKPRFDLILRNWPSRTGHWGQGCWLQKIGKASLLVSFVNKQVFAKCESRVTHHLLARSLLHNKKPTLLCRSYSVATHFCIVLLYLSALYPYRHFDNCYFVWLLITWI